jgi:transcriptional regulator with XRE-family HTH domain
MRKVRKARDIARDRQIFEVMQLFAGEEKVWSHIARQAGVSPSTVRNLWKAPKDGGTRFPHSITLQAIARAAGYKMSWEPIEEPKRHEREDRVSH